MTCYVSVPCASICSAMLGGVGSSGIFVTTFSFGQTCRSWCHGEMRSPFVGSVGRAFEAPFIRLPCPFGLLAVIMPLAEGGWGVKIGGEGEG